MRNSSHQSILVIEDDNHFRESLIDAMALKGMEVRGVSCGSEALKAIDSGIVRQSSLLSFSDAYLVVGCVFLIALPLLLLSAKRKRARPAVVLSDH